MPIEKTITLYYYNELNEKAKEKARKRFLGRGLHSPSSVYFSEESLVECMKNSGFIYFTESGERFRE